MSFAVESLRRMGNQRVYAGLRREKDIVLQWPNRVPIMDGGSRDILSSQVLKASLGSCQVDLVRILHFLHHEIVLNRR